MKNIIIRTPNFIGDTINCTPAIELIKQEYPDAHLTIMGPSYVKELFVDDPRICNFILFSSSERRKIKTKLQIIGAIRHKKFDLGFLFSNSFSSALFFKLGGVKKIVGYKNDGRDLLLDYKIELNRNKHYINNYAGLINEYLGNKYRYLPPLSVSFRKSHPYRFDNTNLTIALYFGGINKGFRRYPDDYATALCRLLYDRGYNLVFVGDKIDDLKHRFYAEQIGDEKRICNLSGKTDIGAYISAIANADLLITIDSSALHIGSLCQRPTIGLMGLSTSPTSAIAPKNPLCRLLKVENNMIREEEYIRNITPKLILEQIDDLLSKK